MALEFELADYRWDETCVSSFTDQVPVEFKGIVYVLTRQLRVAYKIEGAV